MVPRFAFRAIVQRSEYRVPSTANHQPPIANHYQWGTEPEMFGPRLEHRLAMILRETRALSRGARVLDSAVGLGQLAVRLEQSGLRVCGLDYSFQAALHVKRTTSVRVVVGDMTRMPFRDGVFDGITSGETFEHLPDDGAAAGEVARVLRDGAILVATVPASETLHDEAEYDAYYEHLRRYTRGTFAALFTARGMIVEKVRHWGFPVVLLYDTLFMMPMNLRRARKRAAKNQDAVLKTVARAGRSRLLVGLVQTIFATDRLFGWVPFGPGLLIVARKGRR